MIGLNTYDMYIKPFNQIKHIIISIHALNIKEIPINMKY